MMEDYLYGYVSTRSAYGISMPVPAQNSCLREYCKLRNITYILPRVEHHFDNSYSELLGLIEDCPHDTTIGMYTFLMLPLENEIALNTVLASLSSKINLAFVLENIQISSVNQFTHLRQNWLASNLNRHDKERYERLLSSYKIFQGIQ